MKKRKELDNKYSKKLFRKTAEHTNRKNLLGAPLRGGRRL